MKEIIKWVAAIITTILMCAIVIFIGYLIGKFFLYILAIGAIGLAGWAIWLLVSDMKDVIDEIFEEQGQ